RQRFGGELQSHWTRLSRQSHPQHKLAAWWCERVARRQILIRWQLPTVVRTEFSQFPPPLPPMCRRTQPEPARASPVTGVCGFPVINLTHPTADGWSGTRRRECRVRVRRDPVEIVSPRLLQDDRRGTRTNNRSRARTNKTLEQTKTESKKSKTVP